jgi:putative DNA primase/helicase
MNESLATFETPTSLAANPILDAALAYVRHGWRIMPVQEKKPFDPETGRLMYDWSNRASTDPEVISAWFAYPRHQMGIGLPTGLLNNLIVIDIDKKLGKDGFSSLSKLEGSLGPLPPTLTATTPSGGCHYLYRHPIDLDRPVKNATGLGSHILGEATGIDVRADGGQIVVAPTEREGGCYEWQSDPFETTIADLPYSWLQLILGTEKKFRSRSTAVNEVIDAGARNDTLFRAACSLRAKGVGERAIIAELQATNESRCVPPLDCEEVETIARSALRYEPADFYKSNDAGNAKRFANKFWDRVRYQIDTGKWLVWDGLCWCPDATREIHRFALTIGPDIDTDAKLIKEKDIREAMVSWARRSGDRPRLSAMLDLAAADPRIASISTEYDTLPGLLPVRSGVVDLTTGELLPMTGHG